MVDVDLEAIVQRIDDLKKDRCEKKHDLEVIDRQIEMLENALVGVLTQAGVRDMEVNGYTFGWKESKRKSLDQQMVKSLYPDVFSECYTEKVKDTFYFKGRY